MWSENTSIRENKLGIERQVWHVLIYIWEQNIWFNKSRKVETRLLEDTKVSRKEKFKVRGWITGMKNELAGINCDIV